MGTDIWFNVEVTGLPESFKGESLPDFGLINGDKWDASHVWDPEKQELTPTIDEAQCSGEGRYGDEMNITAWARSFTLMVRGTGVTVYTEWHADGYGEESNVYRDGQLVAEESTYNRQVPAVLPDLTTEALAALTEYEEQLAMGEPEANHTRLANALRKLTEGLH